MNNEIKKQPLVSVIMPTHNRSEMLKRAIKSVLSQTYKNFELIVINDGSEDNTDHVVKSQNDGRIIYIEHNKPMGSANARNTGIKRAQGEYIAFLDDDDEWRKDNLEIQIPVIANSSPKVGLVYGWMEYFQNGKSIKLKKPRLRGYIFKEMLSELAISLTSAIIIKKNVINEIGLFNPGFSWGDDGDFLRRLCKKYQVEYVPRVVVNYNIGHNNRITTSKNIKGAILKELYHRLDYFASDFKKHPEAYGRVLIKIGGRNLMIGNIRLWYKFTKKSLDYISEKNFLKKLIYIINLYLDQLGKK